MPEDRLADWIRANGHSIAALELAAPLDDLAPLAELIGSARVVGLGESAHHVREFYQLRHRILRFLVERCGFTVLAMEAPFTESGLLDDWLDGGSGDVAALASAAVPAFSLGEVPELHEALRWLREHNKRPDSTRIRYLGADLPGSVGSPLPALTAIQPVLAVIDPEALPILARATEIVSRFHDPAPMKVLFGYSTIDQAERDALTAALAELVARLHRLRNREYAKGRADEHMLATYQLRGAWLIDQLHREMAVTGIETASTFRDIYIAESIRRLLDRDPSTRIVLTAHNWHLMKAPEPFEADELYPAGYHLAAELGADYRAIGLTARQGRTGIVADDITGETGFPFKEAPLPPPESGATAAGKAIESAFPDSGLARIVDLHAAAEVGDAKEYSRMRTANYFFDQSAFACFDALCCVTETTGTEPTRSS
ncbi:erythromycin esterase [Tamaricihabitans halophyticus]|uniref:Erythromycin esterase n=1 Tax=Tamaricihabitans halophyticus TaxID=1262583 RepID=A0A4R2R604_9PSEU|nr:erythromycin esterase family protein [Tamaricihabitans halophyticus]TCP57259.1 erythromycin esterase [Tamaricihabitans halophyticus]